MIQYNDIVGLKFGKLTVINYDHYIKNSKGKGNSYYYNCKCECGNNCTVERNSLKFGNTKSCGCIHKNQLIKRNKNNGSLKGDSKNEYKLLYQSWSAMKSRCMNTNNKNYDKYGGRGIKLCKEWLEWDNFKQWSLSNRWEKGLTIERIDVNGNYEPCNCEWATYKEQANNKRNNKYLTYKGKTKTLSQWCEELQLNYYRTKARLNTCHLTVEQAFELPKQNLRRKLVN